jgi:sulfide:quinone oxidoreductase
MLCEFKYGGVPAETFEPFLGSQDVPRRAFYHLKKDVFPSVYFNSFVKGTWFGPKGFFRPDTTQA